MSRCERCDSCPFFNNQVVDIPSLIRVMKIQYCEVDKENCARYMVRERLESKTLLEGSPELDEVEHHMYDMLPNDYSRARMIMRRLA